MDSADPFGFDEYFQSLDSPGGAGKRSRSAQQDGGGGSSTRPKKFARGGAGGGAVDEAESFWGQSFRLRSRHCTVSVAWDPEEFGASREEKDLELTLPNESMTVANDGADADSAILVLRDWCKESQFDLRGFITKIRSEKWNVYHLGSSSLSTEPMFLVATRFSLHSSSANKEILVEKVLGSGAFGIVFKCSFADAALGEFPVTLKVVDLSGNLPMEKDIESVVHRESAIGIVHSQDEAVSFFLQLLRQSLEEEEEEEEVGGDLVFQPPARPSGGDRAVWSVLKHAWAVGSRLEDPKETDFVEDMRQRTKLPPDSAPGSPFSVSAAGAMMYECFDCFLAGLKGKFGFDKDGLDEMMTRLKTILVSFGDNLVEGLLLRLLPSTQRDQSDQLDRPEESDVSDLSNQADGKDFREFEDSVAAWYSTKSLGEFHIHPSVNIPVFSWVAIDLRTRHPFLFLIAKYETETLGQFLRQDDQHLDSDSCVVKSNDLEKARWRRRPPWKDMYQRYHLALVVSDIAEQLASLHQVGCLHRDIKPSNILGVASPDTWVVSAWIQQRHSGIPLSIAAFAPHIADFSIARSIKEKLGEDSSDKSLMQKYATLTEDRGDGFYMAPELLRSSHYGTAVDVFSLGMTCYEMYIPPDERRRLLDQIRRELEENSRFVLPVDFRRFYGPEAALIEKMLDIDPERRPRSTEVHGYFSDLAGEMAFFLLTEVGDDLWTCKGYRKSRLRHSSWRWEREGPTLQEIPFEYLDLAVQDDTVCQLLREDCNKLLGQITDEGDAELAVRACRAHELMKFYELRLQ